MESNVEDVAGYISDAVYVTVGRSRVWNIEQRIVEAKDRIKPSILCFFVYLGERSSAGLFPTA